MTNPSGSYDDDGDDESLDDFVYDAQTAPDAATWLRTDGALRLDAIERYHSQLTGAHPPTPNPQIHAVAHDVVETQLAAADPASTTETLARLTREGVDRHSAIHAIGSVIMEFIWEATQPGASPFDPAIHARRLDVLSANDWKTHASPVRPRRSRPVNVRRSRSRR
jgi:hypothetical protein